MKQLQLLLTNMKDLFTQVLFKEQLHLTLFMVTDQQFLNSTMFVNLMILHLMDQKLEHSSLIKQ